MDSGSTGNYVNAEECMVRNSEVEEKQSIEELTIADILVVKPQRRVLAKFGCGGYKDRVYA